MFHAFCLAADASARLFIRHGRLTQRVEEDKDFSEFLPSLRMILTMPESRKFRVRKVLEISDTKVAATKIAIASGEDASLPRSKSEALRDRDLPAISEKLEQRSLSVM